MRSNADCVVQRETYARVQGSAIDMRSSAECGLQRVTCVSSAGFREWHAFESGVQTVTCARVRNVGF